MKLPKYPLVSGDKLATYEFVSIGLKGHIHKLIQFKKTNLKNVFNLAFGDKDNSTGQINDMTISNNGDSEKVLATVIAAVYAFTDKYPEAYIYATGSTKSRTRLYRMGISKYLSEGKKDFEIFGELEDDWEDFQKDGDYVGFLVTRKN